MEFKTNKHGENQLLECDGFYVSYNENPCADIPGFASDNGAETALVIGGNFKILNGDFREDYKELAPLGVDKCLEFYKKNKDANGSSWST